ncbi:MAG: M67 family metallopeptidase [Lachnospiraceae bacterium]|nr:M67 family metallopeptidase [Lachnospiraceae bacterium]
MKITIKESDFNRIYEHALSVAPDEACGLIAGTDGEDGIREIKKVYILENIDHTNEHFTIDPREQLKAVKDMRTLGLTPLGNWHSHPETPSRPSEEDKRLANDSSASYLILSLEKEGSPVLNAFHVEGEQGNKTVRKEELIIVEERQD